MRRFNDSTGKQWELDINLESIELVKSIHGIDLTQVFAGELTLLASLFNEPLTLVSVLWTLCGTEGGDKGAFMRVMRGDALEAGANALVDDIIDFFPSARKREVYRETVKMLRETEDAHHSHSLILQRLFEFLT